MTKSMKQPEPLIRKLCADHNVCDPNDLVSFTETNNLELEIAKKDGSRVRILRRLLERRDDDPVAKPPTFLFSRFLILPPLVIKGEITMVRRLRSLSLTWIFIGLIAATVGCADPARPIIQEEIAQTNMLLKQQNCREAYNSYIELCKYGTVPTKQAEQFALLRRDPCLIKAGADLICEHIGGLSTTLNSPGLNRELSQIGSEYRQFINLFDSSLPDHSNAISRIHTAYINMLTTMSSSTVANTDLEFSAFPPAVIQAATSILVNIAIQQVKKAVECGSSPEYLYDNLLTVRGNVISKLDSQSKQLIIQSQQKIFNSNDPLLMALLTHYSPDTVEAFRPGKILLLNVVDSTKQDYQLAKYVVDNLSSPEQNGLLQVSLGTDLAKAKGRALQIERLAYSIDNQPRTTQDVYIPWTQIDILTATLVYPQNSTAVFTKVSGGASISFAYRVSICEGEKVLESNIIEGREVDGYEYGENLRYINAFGGVGVPTVFPNAYVQEMFARAKGPISIDKLQNRIYTRVLNGIKALSIVGQSRNFDSIYDRSVSMGRSLFQ